MSSPQKVLNCRYHYDPLDRLTSHILFDTPRRHCFYCKSRLATEVQGADGHSIVQHDDLLLAQHQRKSGVLDSTLLATDLQRSVLNTFKSGGQQPIAYSPYGHRPSESGLSSLLGFNGERPDPVTGHYLLGNGYRAFNSVLMRFNSPDSFSPFEKGGLNSYAYCLGDPINLGDSNGHNPFKFLTTLFKKAPKSRTFTKLSLTTESPVYLGKNTNPSPLGDLAMHKTDSMLSAMPGRQIESLLNGPGSSGVKIWDNKTGLRNIKHHVEYNSYNTTAYDVISAGLRGELNGVLPHRANELSILISEGKWFKMPGRSIINRQGKRSYLNIDMARQREIYRQANIPLPEAFHTRSSRFYVSANAKEIRTEAVKY